MLLDAAGNINTVTVSGSLPLPAGAATAALQTAGNLLLASIDGKITACNTGAVVISSSALPTGAATEATLSAASAKLPATLGQKAMAASMAVVIASDQSAIDVNVGSIALPTGASTAAKQDTGNASLASIDSKLTSPLSVAQSGTWTVGLSAGALTIGKVDQGTGGASAWKVDGSAVTQPVSAASLPLPTGAATEAKQDTGNSSLSSIDGKLGSLGQKTMAGSAPVVIASDQSTLPISAASLPLPTGAATSANQTTANASLSSIDSKLTSPLSVAQSGTWNITNISGTVSLPTGAATSANQTTANSSLSSIDGKLANNYGVATGALRVASQIGNASGVADFNSGTYGAQTLRVVVASNQPTIPVSAPVNAAGNSPGSSTVSTVATLTAPANTVGFVLMNLDTSTANIRYRIGAVATSSSGQQLQPGRDTGFIPCGANVSICAESGTQNYDIQWILSA